MDYKQLVRHKFMRRIGMFSVDRTNARSALMSIKYAAHLLAEKGNVLWVFPQGALIHPNKPVESQSGTALLIRELEHVWICPVGLRYEIVHEQYPDAYVRFGKLERIQWNRAADVHDVTLALDHRLNFIRERMSRDCTFELFDEYTTVLTGSRSLEKR